MRSIIIEDIYPLETVNEHSVYLFLGVCIFLFIALFFIIKKLMRYSRKLQSSQRQESITILKNDNLSEGKNRAYQVSYYAKKLAATDEEKYLLEKLLGALEPYKYIKEDKAFSSQTKKILQEFLSCIESSDA